MIGASLQFLAMQLNLHLRRTMSVREDLVVVSRMLENDGKEVYNKSVTLPAIGLGRAGGGCADRRGGCASPVFRGYAAAR